MRRGGEPQHSLQMTSKNTAFQNSRTGVIPALASGIDVEAIAAEVGYDDGATLRTLLRERLGRGVRELRANCADGFPRPGTSFPTPRQVFVRGLQRKVVSGRMVDVIIVFRPLF